MHFRETKACSFLAANIFFFINADGMLIKTALEELYGLTGKYDSDVVYIRRISEDLMARLRKTSQQTINFWLNPALLGLKYLDINLPTNPSIIALTASYCDA